MTNHHANPSSVSPNPVHATEGAWTASIRAFLPQTQIASNLGAHGLMAFPNTLPGFSHTHDALMASLPATGQNSQSTLPPITENGQIHVTVANPGLVPAPYAQAIGPCSFLPQPPAFHAAVSQLQGECPGSSISSEICARGQDLRFTAEDLMLAVMAVAKSPDTFPFIQSLIQQIGDGKKPRHELLFYLQTRGNLQGNETRRIALTNPDTGAPEATIPQNHSQLGEVRLSASLRGVDGSVPPRTEIPSSGTLPATSSPSSPDSPAHDTPIGLKQPPRSALDPSRSTLSKDPSATIDEDTAEAYHSKDHPIVTSSNSSSNTGIRGITWQESRQSFQASICISLKQIYKIFSAKRVGKEKALAQACQWLNEMRVRRDGGESLESLMKAGLFARKVSNTGIRGITWQESRMKFQCSIYMEKGRRVQKYFPTGLNRHGPRYEEAFRKAKEWTRMMEARKNGINSEDISSSETNSSVLSRTASTSPSIIDQGQPARGAITHTSALPPASPFLPHPTFCPANTNVGLATQTTHSANMMFLSMTQPASIPPSQVASLPSPSRPASEPLCPNSDSLKLIGVKIEQSPSVGMTPSDESQGTASLVVTTSINAPAGGTVIDPSNQNNMITS